MKTLVLITSQFPFGTAESFLESELPFLNSNFDKIIIISQNTSAKQTRLVPGNAIIFRYNPSTSPAGFLLLPLLLVMNCRSFINMVSEEMEFRRITGYKLTARKIAFLIRKTIKALQLRRYIKKVLIREEMSENIVFYSYWLKTGAHALTQLRYTNSIRISRVHGSDLYEEKTELSYLPFLKFSAIDLDAVFFISEHGKQYFCNKTKTDKPGFIVSRLGVNQSFSEPVKKKESDYTIVSCSNLVPLKRIDLIISSLEALDTEKKVHWIHFGDGILRRELEDMAILRLGPKREITYSFMGHYPNNELLKYYSENQIDLFINTSSTEGVPVSIMEVQSFGIPVIATDAGGVKELVTDGTGTLLSIDFKPRDLTELIRKYIGMTEEEKKQDENEYVKQLETKIQCFFKLCGFYN